ncbi:MAG: hypothetical protein ACJAT2_002525 [Bacteriovoracaceae bacterium]|jgi:hypothetical protein
MKLFILIPLLFSNLVFATDIVFISGQERLQEIERFELRSRALVEAFSTGDMVGNGGGLLEQNFYQAYYLVQSAIENCLYDSICGLTPKQDDLLRKINQTFILKIDQDLPLIFLKEDQSGGFFSEDEEKETRLAKTGYSEKFPIFINSTLALSISENIPAIIGILIHELGHQTGVLSHSILDELSTKVRALYSDNWVESKVRVGGRLLNARLFSSKNNFTTASLSLVFDQKVKSLDSLIAKEVSCLPGESVYGFYLSNGAWQRPISSRSKFEISLQYWIDIYCLDNEGTIWPIQRDLKLKFEFEKYLDFISKLKNVEAQVN